jgi:pimeloyl-ACP methyl ester carboxylesterase
MPYSDRSGAKIYFETMGPRTDRPLVFIEGMGAQMIGWREPFCQAFVDRGYWVIRLDNRDSGLSQKFGGAADLDGGYELNDMAHDVFGVLDTLGLGSAHIVGQSMGGMVAQTMAILNPQRVSSMTLFYTAPGALTYAADDLADLIAHAQPADPTISRHQAVETMVAIQRFSASTAYAFDEAWFRDVAGQMYDRCYCPEAPHRQLAAVSRGADRIPALQGLQIPAAIIHGRADRLIRLEGAFDLAKALINSELHVFPGMGHEITRPLWGEFINIIGRTADRGSHIHTATIAA